MVASNALLLQAQADDAAFVSLSAPDRQKLLDFTSLASRLLETRITVTSLRNLTGATVAGMFFDAGIWTDHPDFAYAGYTSETKPNDNQKSPVAGVSGDSSHNRRYLFMLQALYSARSLVGSQFPSDNQMRGFTNQFAYSTFNGNFDRPLFTNYANANGWYRVNYGGNPAYGDPPFALGSPSAFTGGVLSLSALNPDLLIIADALYKLALSTDPATVEHRYKYFERNSVGVYDPTLYSEQKSWRLMNMIYSVAR